MMLPVDAGSIFSYGGASSCMQLDLQFIIRFQYIITLIQ